jgi:hypothetical protein
LVAKQAQAQAAGSAHPVSCLIETSSLLFDRDILFMNQYPNHRLDVPFRDAKENLLTHCDIHFAIGQRYTQVSQYLTTPIPHVNLLAQ